MPFLTPPVSAALWQGTLFARGNIHPLVYHQLCQQKDKYFNLVKNMLVFLATFCYSEINRNLEKNLCTDRSMEVKFPVLSGNYDRQTIRPTDDVRAEVSLLIIAFLKYVFNAIGDVRGPNMHHSVITYIMQCIMTS